MKYIKKNYKKKSIIAIAAIFLIIDFNIIAYPVLGSNSAAIPNGNILNVGGSGPGNYSSIQSAIDNASNGDTVFVYDDSSPYYENLIINKSIELIGEKRDTTIIDGESGHVIVIEKKAVKIKKFTLQTNKDGNWAIAAQLYYAPSHNLKNIQLSDCIINKGGVFFNNISDSYITNCHIRNVRGKSIEIFYSSENISISNCQFYNNGYEDEGGWTHSGNVKINGDVYACSNISIFNCNINNIVGDGIYVCKSKNINIYQNNIYENKGNGIRLINEIRNIAIYKNYIYGNTENGITILGGSCANVSIYDNKILFNGNRQFFEGGIFLNNCSNCITIQNNKILLNKKNGILLWESSGNEIIKNHFIFNIRNAYFMQFNYSSENNWYRNYWNRPRLLPKPIFGRVKIDNTQENWVAYDWRPALLPFNIL